MDVTPVIPKVETVKTPNLFLKGVSSWKYSAYIPPIVATVLLLILGQILSPGFAQVSNIGLLLATASVLIFASAGQTLVILSGGAGIDLSVGSLMSMGALLGIKFAGGHSAGVLVSVVVLIGLGGLIGLINGMAIQWLKMPPLVMTMGMATVIDGLVLAYMKGQSSGGVPTILAQIGMGHLFGPVRWLLLLGLALVIVMSLVLKQTYYGKNLFLVGSNRRASLLTGLSVGRMIITTYVLAGILGALSGLVLVANVGSAQLQMASDYTLLTIAAVVIGGTKLSGGAGGFAGSALGAVLITVLNSVLVAVQMPAGARETIQGLILLIILMAYSREPKLRQ